MIAHADHRWQARERVQVHGQRGRRAPLAAVQRVQLRLRGRCLQLGRV